MSPLSSSALRSLTEHRDHWPLPQRPWLLAQSWHHLLFAHWPLPLDQLRPRIPAGLEIDTFGGSAWIGVVPFEMRHVRARSLPDVPGLSAFPELNARTYVRHDGLPGVWFFSLDADHWPAVITARQTFHLPYFKAVMQAQQHGNWMEYQSYRTHSGAPAAVFRGRYRPIAEAVWSTPGSLEYFLTERYYLYAADRAGRLYRAAVQHVPWPLQAAEAEISVNTMVHDLVLPDTAPLLHYAQCIDVLTWTLDPL